MKYLLLLLFVVILHADTTLLTLIESAQHNEKITSLEQRFDASRLNYQATKNSYLPRVDGFGSGDYVNHKGGFDAAQSYRAGVQAQVILFDGFKRENRFDQYNALKNTASSNLNAGKKEISLNVIKRYFELQNTLEEIHTYSLTRDQLEAQLIRLEKFFSVGLASEDALMRLRSALANANYEIEDLSYQSDRQKADLETITNMAFAQLSPTLVLEPKSMPNEELDFLKALRFSRDATIYQAQQSDQGFLPTLSLMDQYTYYSYADDPIASMRVNNQNKLSLSLTVNLLDFNTMSTAKQALIAQSNAQSNDLAYATKEANTNKAMAQKYIIRSHALINAAQTSFDSSKKTFDAVKQKYEARIVDYVTYLDALRSLTDSTNQLSRAKRSLNYAYAAYYYYCGLDPKEFVQ
jgi:outer membrane protein TolC